MKKLKIIFLTLSLLLIGGSTAIMFTSLQSSYFLASNNELFHTISPLRGGPSVLEQSSLQTTPMMPSLSIQDFPLPTVEVFQFTDHEMDLRGYGDDTVRFNMKFRSTNQRARFYGYVQLYDYPANTTQISLEASWDAWVDPNTNITASFDISGYEIYESNENGPYSVRLRFYKDNGTIIPIYDSIIDHKTQPYTYSDFQPRPTIGSITSSVIDNDANGLDEWIYVHVPMTVAVPDRYYFQGTINGGGISEDARNDTYLSVGTHTIYLKFAAWDFQGMSADTITLTNLYIRHDTTPQYLIYSANPSVSIGSYAPTDFDTPPVELTGRFWGEGHDTDGDALYNFYRVVIEVNKLRIEEGSFYLYPDIYKPPSDHIDGANSNYISLDSTGLVNVSVDFNGVDIYKSGIMSDNFIVKDIDGYFNHEADVGWNWNDWFYFSDEFTTSETYDYTEFEGPGAWLTHNFNDYGLDTDGDTLFNFIVVEIEVEVVVEGDYYLASWLEVSSTGRNIDHTSINVHLTVGTHTVSLQYDGLDVWREAVNDFVKFDHLRLEGGSPQTELDYNNTALLSHYLFTNFDPPKARLTGIYSDTVADTDSDGLWDELRISVEVEINQTGRYRVYGALRNQQTSQNKEVSTEPMQVLSVGTVSFVLTFPGSWIWSQHSNTTYLLDYVYIYEVDASNNDIKQWDYRNDPFTTDVVYDSDKFNAPPVIFTGVFTEGLADLDSDGSTDYFILGVEIEVTQTINFDIRLYGYLYIEGESWHNDEYSYDLGVGTYLIELGWFTVQMYQTLEDQTYEIDLYLERTDTWERLDSYLDYETTNYAYTVFDPPGAEFTGTFYDYGVDTDISGDPRFDYFELAFEVNVIEEGWYRIYGYLYADEGGDSYYFYNYEGTVNLSPGLYNLTCKVDSYWFFSHSSGASVYVNYIYLYQWFDGYGDARADYDGDSRYLSRTYYHSEFDPPPIAFSENGFYDYGEDTDSNGKFDHITVEIELNVTEAGTYYVNGWIYCASGGDSLYFNSDYMELSVGLHNYAFQIEPAWVRNHQDGSEFYIGSMYLYQYIPSEGDVQRGYIDVTQYFSRIYYHNEFDPPDAWVTNVLEFYPVDFNSDGNYDVYRVVYEVNVTVASIDLHVYSVLTEQNTHNYITSTSIELYDLIFGMHNISIDFRGEEIHSSGFTSGLQLSRYELTRISDWKLIDQFTDVIPLTILYTYADFAPEYFPLIQVYHITVIEKQSDQLEVNATIFRFSSELVDQVQLETEDGWYTMSRIYMGDNFEIWTLTYSPPTTDGYNITVHAYGSWGSYVTLNINEGIPEIRSFTMNTSLPITLGGTIYFETLVRDPDGLTDVTLVTMGTEYSMNFISESSQMGEIWALDVTFTEAGEYTAYIIATDNKGFTSQSGNLDIIVNEGSVIEDVDINPGTKVNVDTEISFTIEIQKSDAIITSVTLEITDDRGNDYLVPLEIIDETDELEIYGGSYTPTSAGTYECTIRVLNTKNQESIYKVTIEVRSDQDITGAPGFELVVALGILVLLPLSKKHRKGKK